MSKYTEDFKISVVKEYNRGGISYKGLSNKYGIGPTSIREWVVQYNQNKSINIRTSRRDKTYSLDFKLTVVDYYNTNNVGRRPVAAKFNISASQVKSWNYKFNSEGINGLIPKKRGRPLMKKNIRNKPKKK